MNNDSFRDFREEGRHHSRQQGGQRNRHHERYRDESRDGHRAGHRGGYRDGNRDVHRDERHRDGHRDERRGGRHHGKEHAQPHGPKTFRRGRAVSFLEMMNLKRMTIKQQLDQPEFQSIHPVLVGELKAIDMVINEFIQLFEIHEHEVDEIRQKNIADMEDANERGDEGSESGTDTADKNEGAETGERD